MIRKSCDEFVSIFLSRLLFKNINFCLLNFIFLVMNFLLLCVNDIDLIVFVISTDTIFNLFARKQQFEKNNKSRKHEKVKHLMVKKLDNKHKKIKHLTVKELDNKHEKKLEREM